MEINTVTVEPKYVEDFDFVYTLGGKDSFTVDTSAGDTYRYSNIEGCPVLIINLAAKVSPLNSEIELPAEELITVLQNVACISRRVRKARELSPEDKLNFQTFVKSITEIKPPFGSLQTEREQLDGPSREKDN